MGTAMGSAMAPAYASIFMGKFENDFLNSQLLKPTVWFRFIDDIFLIWDHSYEELIEFIDSINMFHETIKFTHNISLRSIPFLDVNVSKSTSLCIETNVYVKNTNIHQYVDYTSSHPKSCKNGIPFSQGKRYRRIVSNDEVFKKSVVDLKNYFLERNYPNDVINNALDKVLLLSQEEALVQSQNVKNNIVPFVIEYNPSLPNIGNILHKYWNLLDLSLNDSVKYVNSLKPIIAYRRPRNIRDFIVKSKFTSANVNDRCYSQVCNRKRCSHCQNIVVDDMFSSTNTNESFLLQNCTDCSTKNVIYLITCKRCQMQYVGQTNQPVSKRMNSHRFDIRNFNVDEAKYASHVAVHFNSYGHSLNDFSFMPIDIVNDTMKRLCKETFWIHKLNTHYPEGLNAKLLYDL